MSRSRRRSAPPSAPISEGRHPLLDPPPQGGGGKASLRAEDNASSEINLPAHPSSVTYVPGPKCYLCSRLHTEGRVRGTPPRLCPA